MTEKAKREDREEAQNEQQRPVDESSELAEERVAECGAQDLLSDASTSDTVSTPETPRARARRTTRVKALESAESEPALESEPTVVSTIPTDLDELEAQGFSQEEAQRLIDISIRLETSAEARASQAELKRLRFAQWLVEHGILNEFSV